MRAMVAMSIQCAISIAAAFMFVRWAATGPDPMHPPSYIILAVGIGAAWMTTFLYVWIRYGWKAARSMRWDG
jgi:hypothetical protein